MTKTEMKALTEAIVKVRSLLTDKQAIEVPALYPVWKENVEYKSGTRVLYNGVLYKTIESHVSKLDLTPDITTNLFANISKI